MSEQLFDTEQIPVRVDGDADNPVRHLRAVAAATGPEDLSARSTQWQLDPATIQAGREGIARAREALRKSRQTKTDKLAA